LGLARAPAVHHEHAVLDAHRVATHRDDALQQDLAGARGMEDGEVAAPWRAAAVGALVDEDLVAGLQRRGHAVGRDPERLEHEQPQQHERQDGEDGQSRERAPARQDR
jgi:hypothetical protein